jgi:hypothetical protein
MEFSFFFLVSNLSPSCKFHYNYCRTNHLFHPRLDIRRVRQPLFRIRPELTSVQSSESGCAVTILGSPYIPRPLTGANHEWRCFCDYSLVVFLEVHEHGIGNHKVIWFNVVWMFSYIYYLIFNLASHILFGNICFCKLVCVCSSSFPITCEWNSCIFMKFVMCIVILVATVVLYFLFAYHPWNNEAMRVLETALTLLLNVGMWKVQL